MAAPKSQKLPARPFVVGINQRHGDPVLRERLFIEPEDSGPVLQRLGKAGLGEAALLATCDRTEVVGLDPDPARAMDRAEKALAQLAGLEATSLSGRTMRLSDERAVRHLFAVAASLESQVLGEPQVLGQVKQAFHLARAAGLAEGGLERLMSAAFGTAKRVRSETGLAREPTSMAAAANRLLRRIHGETNRCRLVLLGLGEMGETLASEMLAAGAADLTVLHPADNRAARAARRLGCHLAPWVRIAEVMAQADCLISALGSGAYLVEGDSVQAALKRRRRQPMLVIDAALPRDVDPAVHELDDAYVYTLDDLEQAALDGLVSRASEAEAAWVIVEQAVEAFALEVRARDGDRSIVRLRQAFEEARERALAEAAGDADLATHLLVRRLLHAPSQALRAAAGTSPQDLATLEASVERLFPDEVEEAASEPGAGASGARETHA